MLLTHALNFCPRRIVTMTRNQQVLAALVLAVLVVVWLGRGGAARPRAARRLDPVASRLVAEINEHASRRAAQH
jgi:hypothetical protein